MWTMRVALLLLGLAPLAAADSADDYFEAGLRYLRRGFYAQARAAFAESLVRAPGQPVPLAFLGLASAAEGRAAPEGAQLLRWAYERLPKGKELRLDLRSILPSERALALLQAEYRRALERTPEQGTERLSRLTVLAFLEVHDGDPASAAALDLLLKEHPRDAYAKALEQVRHPPAKTPPADGAQQP